MTGRHRTRRAGASILDCLWQTKIPNIPHIFLPFLPFQTNKTCICRHNLGGGDRRLYTCAGRFVAELRNYLEAKAVGHTNYP